MEFPADQVFDFLNDMLPGLATAAVTGLIVAPTTAWVVERFRDGAMRRKRLPLLKQIKGSSRLIERRAIQAKFMVEVIKTTEFNYDRFDFDKAPSILKENKDELRGLVVTALNIISQMPALTDRVDKVLDVVTPHLDMKQVADLVEWSTDDREKKDGEWFQVNAFALADKLDDIDRVIEKYGELGNPPVEYKRVSGEVKELPTGEDSLRSRVSEHLGNDLPEKFAQQIPHLIKQLEGKSIKEKCDAIGWFSRMDPLDVPKNYQFAANSTYRAKRGWL
jgi:hypothetical protein